MQSRFRHRHSAKARSSVTILVPLTSLSGFFCDISPYATTPDIDRIQLQPPTSHSEPKLPLKKKRKFLRLTPREALNYPFSAMSVDLQPQELGFKRQYCLDPAGPGPYSLN
jgi:hypothetical protein